MEGTTTYRSGQVAISLYSDILSLVFLLVAEDADWNYPEYVPQTSHVCRYWRQVALQTPQLWNRFRISSPKFPNHPWTHECLRRANSISFDITLDVQSAIPPETIHSIFSDLTRAQALRIVNEGCTSELDHAIKTLFQPYINSPNPNLQALSILHTSDGPIDSDLYQIPLKIFQDEMPNLVSLQLHDCSFHDWTFLISLRSLKFLNLQLVTIPLPSVEKLSLLPLLEQLSITFGQGPAMPVFIPPATANQVICFASLRRFSLGSLTASMASYILKSIYVPLCTNFLLSCNGGTEQDFLDLRLILVRLLTTGAPLLSRIPLHCLWLTEQQIAAISLDDHGHSPDDCNCISAKYAKIVSDRVTIRLAFYPDPWVTGSFMVKNVISPLSLCFNHQSIRFFYCEHLNSRRRVESGLGLELDDQFFVKAQELRVLDVVTNRVGFLDNLVQEKQTGLGWFLFRQNFAIVAHPLHLLAFYLGMTLHVSVPCPQLVQLHIIDSNYPRMPGNGDSSPESAFFNEVADKLMGRKELLGRPLQTLYISNYMEDLELTGLERTRLAAAVHVLEIKDILNIHAWS
ncbi:hypothetical protein AX16_009024 [Volvariella volvacea WC 439]|nr:hypothetical protein AX16_009024 [Volvariella volvacea WC 439]